MATDLLDVVLGGFFSKVSGGLKNVVKFVGDSGIAKKVGNKVLLSTTSGAAGIEALAPATQLMEKAIAGDEKAKEMVAALATKAEGGDKLAKNVMGVLDIAAAGLRAAEAKKADGLAVEAGKNYARIKVDGKMRTFKTKAAYDAYMKSRKGTQPRAGQPPRPGVPGGPQSQQRAANLSQQRAAMLRKQQSGSQQQIAQSMQNMTPQQQQVFQQNLLAQQQANIQQGMLQQQYDPYGYPMGYQQQSGYPAGYAQQSGYPMGYQQQSGYPAGYATPMQSGFPSGYVQQEQFEDAPPDDLMGDTVADVEINDEAE
jgi:hypothetical protein